MNIILKYVNKNAATAAALRDYDNMRRIIDNTPDDIKDLYEQMTVVRSSKLSKTPKSKYPHGYINKLEAQIDELGVMRDRYGQAVEYLQWLEPAWEALTIAERHILTEFYLSGSQRSGANSRLKAEMNYSKSQVERKRSGALYHLRILLFGC